MGDLTDFYKFKTQELFYLDLKKEIYNIEFPLPVLKKDFLKEINTGNFHEFIEFKYFFRGIIYNLAIDKSFLYKEDYLMFLQRFKIDLESLVLRLAVEENKIDIETSNVFLKFNYDNFTNVNSNYYYALTLIELYNKNKESYFLKKAEEVLNRSLEIDERFPLSYYLLGNIEILNNNILKAKYYHLKAKKLIKNMENDISIIEELENKLKLIDNEATLIENKKLLEQSKFFKIIENLQNINVEDYRKEYYLANSYFGIGDYEGAEYYYNIASNFENQDVEFFIDYSYFLVEIGKISLALDIIKKGLELYEDNELLLFNRAIIYINIDEKEKAIKDLENIVSYYDISEEIFNNAMILLDKYRND